MLKMISCLMIPATVLALMCGCAPANKNTDSANTSDSGIIDGDAVTDRVTPIEKSIVLVELSDRLHLPLSFCTGTLIGPHTVLTAAHCFDNHILPGVVNAQIGFSTHYDALGTYKILPGLAHVSHPDYNSTHYYDHDIALVQFDGTIPDGYTISDIDQNLKANYAGEKVLVYGYGRTEDYTGRLNEVLRKSAGDLHSGEMTITEKYDMYPDRYMIANDSRNHLCQGDSGGPQFHHEKNGGMKVIGVNSANYGQILPNGVQRCNSGAQVTKVAVFYKWIKDQQKKLNSIESLETSSEH